jgi:mRNA interferase RelE/StbE
MSHEVLQTRRFARQYKKLHDNIAADVDAAVQLVAADPAVGERKRGDLAALLVYKFRSQGQLYLLGYTVENDLRLVYLEAIGSHENFYRDLKA